MRIRLKIARKSCLYLDVFGCVKINVFRSVFALRLDAITNTKLKQTGELFWDSRRCLGAWVSAF